MKPNERDAIVNELSFESKLGYMAYCVERCLNEARRLPQAARELEQLPDLTQGVARLWARAEQQTPIEPAELRRLLAFAESFEQPDPTLERVHYTHDVTLVQGARVLKKALQLVEDPGKRASYVASAYGGPFQAVAAVYEDYRSARSAEEAIADEALQRLHAARNQPFTRAIFAGIPEWTRGPLAQKYAAGRITGLGEGDEDDDE
jgi:hypothetical protein